MFKRLRFSRSVLLSVLFLLLSTGTYTYSESRPLLRDVRQQYNHYPHWLTISLQRGELKGIMPSNIFLAFEVSKQKQVRNTTIPECIMGTGQFAPARLRSFLINNNRTVSEEEAQTLVQIYIEESENEGVNSDIAFAQMCLETGFLRFDGTVSRKQFNYCGLGVTGNGVKGLCFVNPREGIRAHIQHLKAYATTESLNGILVDQRFKYVKRGSAQSLAELTGKWATDRQYDKKIRGLLTRLYQNN